MKMKYIKELPYLAIPVIGVAFLVLVALLKTFKVWSKLANEESKRSYRVEHMNIRNEVVRTEYKQGNYGSFFLGLCGMVAAPIFFYSISEEIYDTIKISPLVILFPIGLVGCICALQRDRIDKYLSSNPESSGPFTFHYILSFFASFALNYYLIEYRFIKADNIIVYIAGSVFIFLGILGPISLGITSIRNFYKRTKDGSEDSKVNRIAINSILVTSLFLSFSVYYGSYKDWERGNDFKFPVHVQEGSAEYYNWWLAYQISNKADWALYYLSYPINQYEIRKSSEVLPSDHPNNGFYKENNYVVFDIKRYPDFAEVIITNHQISFSDVIMPLGEYTLLPSNRQFNLKVRRKGYKSKDVTINAVAGINSAYIALEEMNPNEKLEEYKRNISNKKGFLYIKPRPFENEDASIRILNIREKFSQGMMVSPGRYKIEIKKKGFETVIDEIYVPSRGIKLEVSLDRKRT